MRRSIFFIALIFQFSLNVFAQSPQAIKYQAVVRDAENNVLRSQPVGVQFTIHQTSESGPVVYTETFATTTNIYGLVSLEVGQGTSADEFSAIIWEDGPYFLETAIDVTGGTAYEVTGINEFLSIPYALYSDTAGYANGADYNSLINKPTTITEEQSNKIDLLTVTSALDLDAMSDDVTANNAKVSFPGFGTVPGKALEGDKTIWEKVNDDIFYTNGNAGIGVPTNAPFGGSRLHVGGGILYDGIPSAFSPGMLYYDNSGDGKFHYVDNTNADYELGPGAITYNDTLWKISNGKVFTNKYVIAQSSLSLGNDAISGEVFGFNTLILKENNLRILFNDTDDPGGTMPANDWQIEVNESVNGGTSHFAIRDITAGTIPFKVMAGAQTNSLFIGADGKVGIGTNVLSDELVVNGKVKATGFIGDGSGLTGITGATGGVSDIGDLTIGADTDNNNTGEIALQTQNTTRMIITNDGKVGIGTSTPANDLEVDGNAGLGDLSVGGNLAMKTITYSLSNETYETTSDLDYNVTGKSLITFLGPDANLQGFSSGMNGQEVTVVNMGNSNFTVKHNGSGTQKILLPGSTDIVLSIYESARFVYDGTSWFCIGLTQ